MGLGSGERDLGPLPPVQSGDATMRDRTRGAWTRTHAVRERLLLALLTVLLAATAAWAPAARAATSVSFLPSEVMVQPGQYFDMSFRVGASADSVASFQLYMSFDPDVVELTGVGEGSLYTESGYMTWFIQDEVSPGFWHFFDTVFGPGTYVRPPGELLHLQFRALAFGYTQAHVDTIRMTNVRRDPLPVTGVEHGEIFVVPASGTGDLAAVDLRIGPASPNPFSNETAISFSLPPAGGGSSAEIYDLAGRLVRRLELSPGERSGSILWDGTDESGREVPSSVYFVRLASGGQEARTRLVRLR
jgi:hypothetical protein